MPNDDPLLAPKDAAHRLEVTNAGLRVIALRGDLPFMTTSTGTRLYRPSDVEALRVRREAQRAGRSAA